MDFVTNQDAKLKSREMTMQSSFGSTPPWPWDKQGATSAPLSKYESIAHKVWRDFERTGQVAIPDGEIAVAVSGKLSSEKADSRRMTALVFKDGSELSMNITKGSVDVGWTPKGEHPVGSIKLN